MITQDGDFRERIVDVADVGKDGSADFRLHLLPDTLGTRDHTVKFLGARTVRPFPIGEDKRISAELDWNDQTNGSYLSAALVLSPEETTGNPLNSKDWLKVEYIGVPPSRNARLVIAIRSNGNLRTLYTEGWPKTNREGRKIAVQRLGLVTRRGSIQVWENGNLLYDSEGKLLFFDNAYLYLQMSSHSNCPIRELYFDNVRIEKKAGARGLAKEPFRFPLTPSYELPCIRNSFARTQELKHPSTQN